MSERDTLKEKMEKLSWKSELVLPCPDTGTCPFSKETKPHQHAFSTRIVPPSDDSRTLLTPVKGVLFWNLEPVPFDPNVDAEPECCFNCGKKGHAYKGCFKRKILFCCNCGRRGVQVCDCPRCAKSYRQFVIRGRPVRELQPRSVDMPSRARSGVRAESRDFRDKSRGRTSNFESRNARDTSRGRARHVESPETKKATDNRRGRSKSVAWFDSRESRGAAGMKNTESREERKTVKVWDDAPADNEMQYENTRVDGNLAFTDSIRNFIEVMAAVKHLPAETQNAVALHFLEEQRWALEKGDWLSPE